MISNLITEFAMLLLLPILTEL